MDKKVIKLIMQCQRNEITEYFIYRSLSRLAKGSNRKVLMNIAEEELRHYHIWEKYSDKKIKPDRIKYWFYFIISLMFGISFGVKLMEKGEGDAQVCYNSLCSSIPEASDILKDETEHEAHLIRMINEEKLKYMGSIVLGLNDALVEFTGALAGFTFALANSGLIAVTGLIMGFSASLSMAASEYLSTKTEKSDKNPLKASFFTGSAYVVTVVFLVFPYFILNNCYHSLAVTILLAVCLIAIFTFYNSVVNEISFKKRFLEMVVISMGVAVISFIIGLLVRRFLHVDI
ncbi:MAG: VIT1/CCC1 transporter family protein [Endomicrobiales bacterium]|nr:VIT1/CCC1 transporter family protein [Endomicrobiales bacterium]